MSSGKDNRIEGVDIHHTLEAVVVGVGSQDVAVQGEDVQGIASTVAVEGVVRRTWDSLVAGATQHEKAEGHASIVGVEADTEKEGPVDM